jgi:pimeloyl-ACP methyl ester carboxylesterase
LTDAVRGTAAVWALLGHLGIARATVVGFSMGGWVALESALLHRDPHRALDPPAIERLGEISAPVLVVVGERDLPDFRAMADLAAAGIPGAAPVVVPAAGHMSPMDSPEAFPKVLLQFVGA